MYDREKSYSDRYYETHTGTGDIDFQHKTDENNPNAKKL